MPLSGSVLKSALKSSILSQLQTLFPIPAGLQPAEQALMQSHQEKLAQAIADGDGPTTVSHITGNAVVNTGIPGTVTSGAGAGGSTTTTGPGSIS